MRKTTKKLDAAFQPTSRVRVIPKNRRTEMAPEARQPHNIKVRTNIHLDLDVIHFFKERAKAPGALPYQTQINAELRRVMTERRPDDIDINKLVRDEKLIKALARRVRELV